GPCAGGGRRTSPRFSAYASRSSVAHDVAVAAVTTCEARVVRGAAISPLGARESPSTGAACGWLRGTALGGKLENDRSPRGAQVAGDASIPLTASTALLEASPDRVVTHTRGAARRRA